MTFVPRTTISAPRPARCAKPTAGRRESVDVAGAGELDRRGGGGGEVVAGHDRVGDPRARPPRMTIRPGGAAAAERPRAMAKPRGSSSLREACPRSAPPRHERDFPEARVPAIRRSAARVARKAPAALTGPPARDRDPPPAAGGATLPERDRPGRPEEAERRRRRRGEDRVHRRRRLEPRAVGELQVVRGGRGEGAGEIQARVRPEQNAARVDQEEIRARDTRAQQRRRCSRPVRR